MPCSSLRKPGFLVHQEETLRTISFDVLILILTRLLEAHWNLKHQLYVQKTSLLPIEINFRICIMSYGLCFFLAWLQEIPMSSNSQMYLSTEEIKAKLVEEYRNSEISMDIRQRVRELAHNVLCMIFLFSII